MNQLTVLIDNGHGENTPCKQSPDKVIREYKYNREIAAALYDRLYKDARYNVILITPEETDISLYERVNRINKYCKQYGAKNCIMVSIHLNAAGNGEWTNATGWECYTTKGITISDNLSKCFYEAAYMVLDSGEKIRTDTTDGDLDKEANYYIIKGANCAAVLTENFFMDGREDYKYLLSPDGFNKIINIHVLGISNYYFDYFDNDYKRPYVGKLRSQ
jgi:N-acetylmuramoyl-L-alanine amidase